MPFTTSLSQQSLYCYVASQINHFFPDNESLHPIESIIASTIERLQVCIDSVRLWQPGYFNHLHSSQYCTFLYFLSRVAYEELLPRSICTKIFLLNKCLNGIDLFYEIKMPSKFFIGHSVGIVLSKAEYGEHLVIYQNSTVGKSATTYPVIGESSILYPNTAVIGDSNLSPRTTLSQGARLVDCDTPSDSLVFGGYSGKPVIIKARKRYIEDYFKDV